MRLRDTVPDWQGRTQGPRISLQYLILITFLQEKLITKLGMVIRLAGSGVHHLILNYI